MNTLSPERKITFFLGAGFSCEAKLPTMNGFGDFSHRQLWGDSQDGGVFHGLPYNRTKLAYGLLKKSGEIYEGFSQFCRQKNRLISFHPENMEDMFTVAEMMSARGQDDIRLLLQDIETGKAIEETISFSDLLDAIRLWLWFLMNKVPLHNPGKWQIDDYAYTSYKKFFEFIKNYGDLYGFDNISIVTTNYDILPEYLSDITDINISYPLEFESEPSLKNNQESHSSLNIFEKNQNLQKCLNICKLHGSVNYFEKKGYNNSKLKVVKEKGGPVGNSKVKDTLPCVTALDAIYKLYSQRNLIPSLIPPTYAKFRDHPWLRSTWSQAVENLSKAGKWIFIGYSFPPSDGHLRSLVNLALMESNTFPKITVVDPTDDIVHNYKKIFGDQFEFYKNPFSVFVNVGYLENF